MTKYYRELWNSGPVRTEARRLAELMLKGAYARDHKDWNLLSQRQKDNAITVMLFNSEDVFLKRAKFNLDK